MLFLSTQVGTFQGFCEKRRKTRDVYLRPLPAERNRFSMETRIISRLHSKIKDKIMLERYKDYRDQIQTGDHIGWGSSSCLGWLIRRFSGGEINHSSLVIRFHEYSDRVMVLEALAGGIVLRSLSNRLEAFKGMVYWDQVKSDYDYLRPAVGRYALSEVGTKYDYVSLFRNAFHRVEADPRKMICSEYWFFAWAEQKIRELDGIGKAPRPSDIRAIPMFDGRIQIFP